jgi:hypothetical protein
MVPKNIDGARRKLREKCGNRAALKTFRVTISGLSWRKRRLVRIAIGERKYPFAA